MAKRKCRHRETMIAELKLDGVVNQRWCSRAYGGCGDPLSLGPSNDAPAEVQIEMRAAELDAAPRVSIEQWPIGMFEYEANGWIAHKYGSDLIEPSERAWAGWLAAEMADHDVRGFLDDTAWPWDSSRPVAGQYEAWAYEHLRAADPDCRDEDDGELHAFDDDCDDTVPRNPGCECHWEEGDSPCPVHPSQDDAERDGAVP